MQQSLAAHGWLVFEPNYRGSDSAGGDFYASIYKDAGQGPGEDVMSGVEALKRRGLVDPSRMAVTDWVEMYDLSDGNVTITEQTGISPWVSGGMAANRLQSPSSSITRIKAPTLIMSDTSDFRVPITQSFGLYRALKDNHVTTEFYAIPVGGHFPGDPVRQMDVYQRWIDWLVKYL